MTDEREPAREDLHPPTDAEAPPGLPAPPPPPQEPGAGSPEPAGEQAPSRRLLGRPLLVGTAVVVAVVVGVGAYALFALRGTEDVLDDMVPASSAMYLTAYLDPAADQKLNLRNLVGKFPSLRSTEDLSRRVDDLLDEALAPSGLSAEDVRAWVGSQVALTILLEGDVPRPAILIRSRDDEAARASLAALREGSTDPAGWTDEDYEGVTVSSGPGPDGDQGSVAVLDGTVVLADDPGTVRDVIDAARGGVGSLAEDERYRRASEALAAGRLGLLYMDLRPVIEQLQGVIGASGVPPGLPGLTDGQLDGFDGFAATMSARSTGLTAEFSLLIDAERLDPEQRALLDVGSEENEAIAMAPRDAFAVIGATGFDRSLETFFEAARQAEPGVADLGDELGIAEAIEAMDGDLILEVGPGRGPIPDGALLLGVDDEAAMRTFLDGLADVAVQGLVDPLTGATPSWSTERHGDVEIATLEIDDPELASLGIGPAYAVAGGVAIIASSVDEVKAVLDARTSGDSIEDADRFRVSREEAGGGGAVLYVDVEAVARSVRATLSGTDLEEFDREVAPDLTPVKAFLLSAEVGDDRATARMFVLVE